MDKNQFNKLSTGDIVKHEIFGDKTFVVTSNYGDRITAVQSVDLTNPGEWDLVAKSSYEFKPEK